MTSPIALFVRGNRIAEFTPAMWKLQH